MWKRRGDEAPGGGGKGEKIEKDSHLRSIIIGVLLLQATFVNVAVSSSKKKLENID